MRIRKNKKLTASIIWSTAASSSSPKPPEELLQAHVCVVNRSPWDAPPSPPLPQLHHHNHQIIEGDSDSFGLNGSLACDNNSIDSMKVSSESLTVIPNLIESGSTGHCPPNSCDLAATSKNDNDKDLAVASIEPPKRKPGRPRKVAVAQPPPQSTPANNNNPHEFYYYSGFGPRWGKRRGVGDDDHKPADDNSNKNKKKNRKRNNNIAGGGTSSYYRVIEGTDEELDLIDEDDDDDDEDDNGGRKRMRKPVKARSLKSLM